MRKLHLRRQAQVDVRDAAGWYEDQKKGLGIRFLDELDHVLSRIQGNPFQFLKLILESGAAYTNGFPIPCISPLERPLWK